MKTIHGLFFLFLLVSFPSLISAQCKPDITVTDTDLPGEIFPLQLNFKQGVPTSLVLTILPPPTAVQGQWTVSLYRIVLRGLQNMPSWLHYWANAPWVETGNEFPSEGSEFKVGSKYCIYLWGTPPADATIGLNNLGVMVDAYSGNATTEYLVAENTNGGNIVYSVCAQTDTTCWPEKLINPGELVFKYGIPFSDTLSYVPPPQMSYSNAFYNLSKVVVREITGLPSWVTYTINAPTVTTGTSNPVTGYEMLVGKKYKIKFSGTPDSSFIGSSNFILKMDPYLHNGSLIAENISGEQITYRVCRATNTACFPTGVEDLKSVEFRLMPFSSIISGSSANISFYSDCNKSVFLNIFDILGKNVYSATMQASYGANNFEFKCSKFNQGTYIFTVSDNQTALKGKLIKTQEK